MTKLMGALVVGTVVVFNAQLVVAQTGDGLSTSSDVDSTGDNSHPAATNVGTASDPRIDSDCRVTFRLMAPNADQVQVFTNYGLGTDGLWDMSKDEDGVWMTVSPPIVPGFHYYAFLVDGLMINDPGSSVFFGTGEPTRGTEILEAGVDFYDIKDVPHGEVRSRWYHSRLSDELDTHLRWELEMQI